MRKLCAALAMVGFSLFLCASSCKKNEPPVEEIDLQITTDPANGSIVPAESGTVFPVEVTVTSEMPPGGVTYSVNAATETGVPFYTIFPAMSGTKEPKMTFNITDTPEQVVCIVTVKVTSVATPTNTATSTYRYSRK